MIKLPEFPSPATPRSLAASLEESLNQLLQLRDQMNREIDAHMDRLREIREELETQPAAGSCARLFEADPACTEVHEGEGITACLPPIESPSIDPHLEQATLDELNAALAMAFSQMSRQQAADA